MMAVEKLNYIKSLKQLLMGLGEVVSTIDVTGVAIDSREIEPGNLFIAYRGTDHNGLDYIDEAIKSGAAAIAIDELEAFEVCQVLLGVNFAQRPPDGHQGTKNVNFRK